MGALGGRQQQNAANSKLQLQVVEKKIVFHR
jgi:hypothetical protein